MSNRLEKIINLKLNNFEIKVPEKKEMIEPNPCWEGYEAIGTKIVDGREVPNCVPIKEEQRKVKEGFPIPSPSGEDEQEYIGKCISAIKDEYPEEGQAYAICKGKWDEK
jgi:hypothetical protein